MSTRVLAVTALATALGLPVAGPARADTYVDDNYREHGSHVGSPEAFYLELGLGLWEPDVGTGAFDAVLFKPLDRDALLKALADGIAAVPGAEPRITTRRACAAASGDEAPPLDLDRALAHHAGRPQLLLRLLSSFREHYGDAADRLEARLAADDREDAAGLAHALHGVAGSFGAEPLRRAARELERRLEAGEPAEAAARAFREALAELLAVTGALLEQPPALLQDTIAEG